jgi:TM2 domain-containing membrane protein YozV
MLSIVTVQPDEPSGPRMRSRATAFMLSLLLPGIGHMYCGKTRTGMCTALFYVLCLAGFFSLGNAGWVLFRPSLALYIFAFVDSFLTAQEISAGVELPPYGNPRVAAILNLLTRGFGYFYAGEKKLGIIVFFVLLGFAQWPDPALIVAMEFAYIAMAIHAYRLCRKMYLTPDSEPRRPDRFENSVYAIAGILAVGYIGLVLVGLTTNQMDHSAPPASPGATVGLSSFRIEGASADGTPTRSGRVRVLRWRVPERTAARRYSRLSGNSACRWAFIYERRTSFMRVW